MIGIFLGIKGWCKEFAGKLVIVFSAVNWKDVFIKTIKTG